MVGFTSAGALRNPHDDSLGELYTLSLLRACRGNRIGYRLCTEAFDYLRQTGLTPHCVWVLEANPALAFYQRLGGTVVARSQQAFGIMLPKLLLKWD